LGVGFVDQGDGSFIVGCGHCGGAGGPLQPVALWRGERGTVGNRADITCIILARGSSSSSGVAGWRVSIPRITELGLLLNLQLLYFTMAYPSNFNSTVPDVAPCK
jgi:hypothetical protein